MRFLPSLFVFLLFLNTNVKACALCAIYDPTVFVSIDLKTDDAKLKQIKIVWEFTKTFSQQMDNYYDFNQNLRLDEDEWKQMHLDFIETMHAANYHLRISSAHEYVNLDERSVIEEDVERLDEKLVFYFVVEADLSLEHEKAIVFHFADENGILGFFAKGENPVQLHGSDKWILGPGTNLYASAMIVQLADKDRSSEQYRHEPPASEMAGEEKPSGFYLYLAETLNDIAKTLRDSLEAIKGGDYSSLLFLLGFSFLYGMVHAAGPGHGKTLVGSYFLANDRSYSKAILISLMIGVVHIFSALMFTLAIILIVKGAFDQALDDSTQVVNLISGFIIVGIATHLLYKKLAARKKIVWSTEGHQHHHVTCGCNSCAPQHTTDLGLVISAGILPCPGTVTIFIFTLSLGLYLTGFLAALSMSLGMSLVIAVSAIAATALKQGIRDRLPKIITFAEYAGLAIVLILGILLVLASLA